LLQFFRGTWCLLHPGFLTSSPYPDYIKHDPFRFKSVSSFGALSTVSAGFRIFPIPPYGEDTALPTISYIAAPFCGIEPVYLLSPSGAQQAPPASLLFLSAKMVPVWPCLLRLGSSPHLIALTPSLCRLQSSYSFSSWNGTFWLSPLEPHFLFFHGAPFFLA